jgi:NAD(P)-dependent dehydrogenase (short-subunit alcohol dehydrogenase family)
MKTALVTGANRGIGFEFVRQLRADNYRVFALVRNLDTAGDLKRLGADIHVADLRDIVAVEKIAHDLNAFAIDLLIANAGVYEGRDVSLGQTDEAWWIEAFRINAIGPVMLARSFREHVRRSKQRKMIALSSTFGSIALNKIGGHYAYRSSKAALNAAWHALSIDEPDLISVLFNPGHVRTRMSGPHAPLSPEESVASMLAVIEGLTIADTGQFFNFQGQNLAW